MKAVVLTRGLYAVVDDKDFARVSKFRWYARRSSGKLDLWYASKAKTSECQHTLMHRFLCPDWPRIDHVDNNGLNNRRRNLRPASYRENNQNARKREGALSKYKGVTYERRYGTWIARISVNGRNKYLGSFPKEIAAARAYDRAAHHHFKAFARPNYS